MSLKHIILCDICGRMCGINEGAEVDVGATYVMPNDGRLPFFRNVSITEFADEGTKAKHVCMDCVEDIMKIGLMHGLMDRPDDDDRELETGVKI